MRAAMPVSFGWLALEHKPARFQRLEGLIQLEPLGSYFGDFFLNVNDCAFQIVHKHFALSRGTAK